jgi:hypothetical protein
MEKLTKYHPNFIERAEIINKLIIPKLIYQMYYSEIEEDVIEKFESYLKWFLFSTKPQFEVTKMKVGLDRCYQLNDISRFGIQDIRKMWWALRLKFLVTSTVTENSFKIIMREKLKEEELEIRVESPENWRNINGNPNEFSHLYNIFRYEKMELKFKELNGFYYRTESGSYKIISSECNENAITIRKGKERVRIESFKFTNLERNGEVSIKLSDILDYISECKIDGREIKIKNLTKSEGNMQLTEGQKRLEATYRINILKQVETLQKIKVISKVKALWLTVLLNSISIEINMHFRGADRSKKCQICEEEDEDMGHLFERCRNAKRIIKLKALKDIQKKSWCMIIEGEREAKLILMRNFLIWKIRCEIVIGKFKRKTKEIETELESLLMRQKANNW